MGSARVTSGKKTSPHFPHYCGVRYTHVSGIGRELDCYRRDNSNVIKAGDYYYVYYNKGPAWKHFLNEWRGSVWVARSTDGLAWEEVGEMIPTGTDGTWDGWSTYCPNIMVDADGSYYLYFTGQPACQAAETPIHIGVGVSESPEGPFEKYGLEPVFSPSGRQRDFDGYRVDDASVIPREGRYWMYYKGRGIGVTVCETKVGLAVSDTPVGPWRRHAGSPVIAVGHEIMAWPHEAGIAVYGYHCLDPGTVRADVFHAADGVGFSHEIALAGELLRNPGGYFADCYAEPEYGSGGTWGISFVETGGTEYLIRYDMDLRAPRTASDRGR